MKLFDVYNQYTIEPVRGNGPYVFDSEGTKYLDFYGGHAVISIGHSHPVYIETITNQLQRLGFYSNAVQNQLQHEYARKLSQVSGLFGYELFLCNSGAEANENALKLASFKNGRTKILALKNGFHGRTSAAVRVTDNPNIQAPINKGFDVEYLDINDIQSFEEKMAEGEICAVIIEAIQGIGGCHSCSKVFLERLSTLCNLHDTSLIMDEVQCGFARSGKFFAFQHADIKPDIITMAKGMGNGFPIGGIFINSQKFSSRKGMLGSTFGGNHLACAAGIAVLDVFEQEEIISNAEKMGRYLTEKILESIPNQIKVLGKGLMLGLKMNFDTKQLRNHLLYEKSVFVGSSADPNIIRILPPLNINEEHILEFTEAFSDAFQTFSGQTQKF